MNAVKPKEELNREEEGCVQRIGGVDDHVSEGSGEPEKLGERKTVHKHDLQQPSEQERIDHEMTHLPFRSWRRHCIK